MKTPKKVVVIGAGFAGLSSASYLAKAGFDVVVVEKHSQAGGRARTFEANGFVFDMGPSWYWMPDVFEKFFNDFGKTTSDFYELKRLDPSYKVVWGKNDYWDIPADYQAFKDLLESTEKGASSQLDEFMRQAEFKYQTGIQDFVQRPSLSVFEFMDVQIARAGLKMDLFKNMSGHVRKFFKNDKITRLMEFPVLFLGSTPSNIPALYSLMNYADIKLGTWYPMGGMHEIVKAMVSVAESQGAKIRTSSNVEKIVTKNGKAIGVMVNGVMIPCDYVVGGADYHHVETKLLDTADQSYSDSYWEKRVMAPSCLLYYIGVSKQVSGLKHHNLFFDADFGKHSAQIYTNPDWPNDPLFYACVPSKTDPSVAPEGKENIFLLIPVAPGMKDTEEVRKQYFDVLIDRLEHHTGESIRDNIEYSRSYAYTDFVEDYNAFKGNAYGLANTLLQTAFLKPRLKSKKVENLFFSGQLTVPGPGVPPAIISGEVVARQISKEAEL